MSDKTPVLIDQPTSKPTNKVVAATAGSSSGVTLAWLIVEAFGIDGAAPVFVAGDAVITWADLCLLLVGTVGSFVAGYIKRENS